MAVIGYQRVSANAQDAQLQNDALAAAGCSKIYEDKASGKNTERPGLPLRSRLHA
jgi:DNA invertase Pin-like site-specific DNA recombinase